MEIKNKFKAFILKKNEEESLIHSIEEINKSFLMDGNVVVKVEFSSFNYKDGLAITGKLPVIKKYPMIPGVDFSGVVVDSKNNDFKIKDKVILNGWGVGEKHFGGFSQYARLESKWLIKLPKRFSFEESMVIGSAGYTASLCVLKLLERINNKKEDKIIVTGASGGVGSVAIHLLANLGYKVTALSGKNKNFLYELGASDVIDRDQFTITQKPLESEKWTAAIDTVGGDILSTVISQMKYDGIIASTGLAKSPKLSTTVFPFILRNVTLAGVDCVYAPYARRVNAWNFLESNLELDFLNKIKTIKPLNELSNLAEKIIKGEIKGRTVIDVNN